MCALIQSLDLGFLVNGRGKDGLHGYVLYTKYSVTGVTHFILLTNMNSIGLALARLVFHD